MISCAIYQTSTGVISQVSHVANLESIAAVCSAAQSAIEVDPSVSDHTHYIVNGAVVAMPAQLDPAFVWDWSARVWVDPRTLAQRQATKWAEIKAHKATLDAGNFTCPAGTFQINKENIAGAVIDAMLAKAAGENFLQPWVLADNTKIVMNADQMIAVGRAMKAYISSLSVTSEMLRAQIYAPTTTTQAQLDAITWPT